MAEGSLNPFSGYTLDSSVLNPDYGLPAQFDSMLSYIFDGIIGTISFVFGLQHQTDLSKSTNYVVSVLIFFVVGLSLSELAEYIKWGMSRSAFRRPWPMQIMLKLAMIVVLYTTGFVARVFTGAISDLPKKGPFGWDTLYMAFIAISLMVFFLYQPQMKQNPRNEIANEIRRMAMEDLPDWLVK